MRHAARLFAGCLCLLLGGCTLDNVPPNVQASAVLDGSVAVGFRHLVAVTNTGTFIADGMHPPCVGAQCGRQWLGFDYGPNITPAFALKDPRMYYDQPTDRFIGVSILNETQIGVLISLPDSQDWTAASGYPTVANSFPFPAPDNHSDQPKLGIGSTAILIEGGDSTKLLYCDKASFLNGVVNCSVVDGGHPRESNWMPVHATAGTGNAVYAVRLSLDGCALIIGRGTGAWNKPTWQTQSFPLTNCVQPVASAPQPPGGAQVLLRANNDTRLPIDDAYFTTGNILALVADICNGVLCERLFDFAGDWGKLKAGQLCTMADGNVSLYDGSVAMLDPPTFTVGGVLLASGPSFFLSTIGWGYDVASKTCPLHIVQAGSTSLAVTGSVGSTTTARVGDFSMTAPDPQGDWGWSLGQYSGRTSSGGLSPLPVLNQVCRTPVFTTLGGYCK